jgi:hypothetical protein
MRRLICPVSWFSLHKAMPSAPASLFGSIGKCGRYGKKISGAIFQNSPKIDQEIRKVQVPITYEIPNFRQNPLFQRDTVEQMYTRR